MSKSMLLIDFCKEIVDGDGHETILSRYMVEKIRIIPELNELVNRVGLVYEIKDVYKFINVLHRLKQQKVIMNKYF